MTYINYIISIIILLLTFSLSIITKKYIKEDIRKYKKILSYFSIFFLLLIIPFNYIISLFLLFYILLYYKYNQKLFLIFESSFIIYSSYYINIFTISQTILFIIISTFIYYKEFK
ncbi:hypothetical protein YN1_1720 [Nanoarchaeota archaeon]